MPRSNELAVELIEMLKAIAPALRDTQSGEYRNGNVKCDETSGTVSKQMRIKYRGKPSTLKTRFGRERKVTGEKK